MKKTAIFICLSIFIFASCSTAPKNPGDITILRRQGEGLLESGNGEASAGNFQIALSLLTESKRNAILADDSSLIIRSGLSRGNVLFSIGRTEDAFLEWDQAIEEAQKFKNSELLSLGRIYKARGNLLSERIPAQAILDEVIRESENIKRDRLFLAFSWQVRGLSFRALGRWNEAESAVKNSLQIHERDRRFEHASYDWYLIASIRSLAGNFQGALDALEASINFDRRIENSWGLAASWRAVGDVYSNASRYNEANEAYKRAVSIYTAMGQIDEANETNRRMRNQ